MADPSLVPKVYNSVVEDVIMNVREAFIDEGIDDQVLLELKQLWESKLKQSKAVDGGRSEQDQVTSVYAQQQQAALQQQQQQQQQRAQEQQRARVQQQQVPSAVQLPVYNPDTGTIELSGAAQAAAFALPAGLYQQQALSSGAIIQGQGGVQYIIQAAPGSILQTPQSGAPATTQVIGPNVATAPSGVIQLDGPHDDSSSDDDEDDEDGADDDDNEDEEAAAGEEEGEEEDPLNSGDDVSEDEPGEIFDTDNVVVCQFDKINKIKNRWKFHLKDGIMNLKGKDYVFQKALGDAEW